MSIAEKLVTIAPEFAEVAIADMITLADLQIANNLCNNVEKRELIVAYLAAHMLTIANRKLGAAGDVQSMSEGRLSIAYTNGTSDIKTGLSNTSYGKECDRLAKSCVFPAMTRVSL